MQKSRNVEKQFSYCTTFENQFTQSIVCLTVTSIQSVLQSELCLLQDWCCCCYGHYCWVEVAGIVLFFDKILTFTYLYVSTHLNEVREQLMAVYFHQTGPQDQTQVIRPYSKGLYLLTISRILMFLILWLVERFSINGDTLGDRLWKFINAFYS